MRFMTRQLGGQACKGALPAARSAVCCPLTMPRLPLVVLPLVLLPLPLPLLRRVTLLVRLPAAMWLLLLRLRHGDAPKRHAGGEQLLLNLLQVRVKLLLRGPGCRPLPGRGVVCS